MVDNRAMNAVPNFEQTLSRLIATPSVSSTVPQLDMSNRAVCEQLANWLEPLGFRCELLPVGPDKLNLIASRGHGDGGLVLSGHTDTVPFDDSGWHSDPFTLKAAGDRWHGLGSCDMKGFLALCVQLAAELKDQKLDQPLIILATADEESGMDGAKALLQQGRPLGRHALVGEPTGLVPIRMHKGIFMDALKIRGQAGHSSDPDGGVNAVEGVHKALAALLALRDELTSRQTHAGFSVPHATLNPGCVHGGDSPNRIPAACELQFDLRPLPGMSLSALRQEARQRIDAALTRPGLSCTRFVMQRKPLLLRGVHRPSSVLDPRRQVEKILFLRSFFLGPFIIVFDDFWKKKVGVGRTCSKT